MFLGTNEKKTVFWIEADPAEVIANLERTPTNKFFLLKPTPAGVVNKPVNVAANATNKTISRRLITVDGKELN